MRAIATGTAAPSASGDGRRGGKITDAQKTELRTALDSCLKPFLVA